MISRVVTGGSVVTGGAVVTGGSAQVTGTVVTGGADVVTGGNPEDAAEPSSVVTASVPVCGAVVFSYPVPGPGSEVSGTAAEEVAAGIGTLSSAVPLTVFVIRYIRKPQRASSAATITV